MEVLSKDAFQRGKMRDIFMCYPRKGFIPNRTQRRWGWRERPASFTHCPFPRKSASAVIMPLRSLLSTIRVQVSALKYPKEKC